MNYNNKRIPDYKYLVFSGGGVAGVAYAGAVDQLNKTPEFSFDKLQGVAGSSIGAIAALMVSLKYTPDEINNILSNINLKQLGDGGSIFCRIWRFFTRYGIYKGQDLNQVLLEIVKNKTNRNDTENVTFADLHKLGCIDLHVVATKLYKLNGTNTGKRKTFSFESTPDTPVVAAVRASAATPVYFKRVRLKKIRKGQYVLDEEGDIYDDGGLVNNMPMDVFDKPKYVTEVKCSHKDIAEITNPNTLGLALLTKDQIIDANHVPVKTHIRDFHILDFLLSVFNTAIIRIEMDGVERKSNRYRTIQIDRLNVSLADFSMDASTRAALIASGKLAVSQYFNALRKEVLVNAAVEKPADTVTAAPKPQPVLAKAFAEKKVAVGFWQSGTAKEAAVEMEVAKENVVANSA